MAPTHYASQAHFVEQPHLHQVCSCEATVQTANYRLTPGHHDREVFNRTSPATPGLFCLISMGIQIGKLWNKAVPARMALRVPTLPSTHLHQLDNDEYPMDPVHQPIWLNTFQTHYFSAVNSKTSNSTPPQLGESIRPSLAPPISTVFPDILFPTHGNAIGHQSDPIS